MSINLSVPKARELKPRILVCGVGGAGGNAVNNMIQAGLQGVDFIVANTDAQALSLSSAERRIQLGASITEGLGAGSRPEVGCASAEEALNEVIENLQGSHMVFITAGMGGGTGTGAAPVIARAAREMGILTIGVVTKPFQFEGSRRLRIAEEGILELQRYVDTLIIIPNQNLFRVANENTTFADAFAMADEVLHSGVAGITDLMIKPGLINLDFADVRTVMNEMGKAMMGTGEATGEKRAIEAAEAAISNPLLDEVSMKGAKGVLINITGGMDMTLYEVDEAANRIRSEVDPEANIIVGSTFDTALDGRIRVSVVATGIEAEGAQQTKPAATESVTVLRPKEQRPSASTAAQAASQAAETARRTSQHDHHGFEAEVVNKAENAPHIPSEMERVQHRQAPAEFATAKPVPVSQGRAPRKGPGFFARLGLGRSRDEDQGEAPAERREPAPGVETRASAPQQTSLMAPAEGRLVSGYEDEQLEIPTFLRRQAN
ncbi:MAG: cell division protein FtsZ [Parvibaculaceae bacterium]|nr:cell division protein FtsZ [Parvibaculaceae bacterium]